ncbi:hypothetical protein V6N13_086184 [Hibiscus sabdariffa]|uniref:Uncharacterized protein n=1 Tax=Hibiscus sabdariffa TaxID=183260 RepID=A0ABR2FSE6_9ROSI
MPVSTLISLFQNMETCSVPVCLHMRRKKHQRLRRTVLKNSSQEDNKSDTISMLHEFHLRGTTTTITTKVPSLRVEALRKWRDAHVEMMHCFAVHVRQLNNN